MINKLVKSRRLNIYILFSFLFAVLFVPVTAEAGILGNVLSAIRPYAKITGQIGGALAGAVLCSAFCPPLGSLAGAVVGWMVGGILANYATCSLTSMMTVAGAAVGMISMATFGPIGYIGGALLGGLIGRVAMGLLYRGDGAATGGILFSSGAPVSLGANALAPEVSANRMSIPPSAVSVSGNVAKSSLSTADMTKADAAYRSAYEAYVSATREGDSAKINITHKDYLKALENYRKIVGTEPK